MSQQHEDIKQNITTLFNKVSGGYDHEAMRYFPFTADAIIHLLRPEPGSKVLDIATGTGAAAVAAAQVIGPTGRVQAIDLSDNMLDKAVRNVEKMALSNVDFHIMDAERLDFKNHYFDYAICSFAIFFLPDIPAAIKSWMRVLKPGGRLVFTIFADSAFMPMVKIFKQQLETYGIDFGSANWGILTTKEQCHALLEQAGATEIEIHEKQMGFHLNKASDWWDIIWNSAMRGFVDQLSESRLAQFKKEHLKAVGELATDKGIWLDVMVYFATGKKQA